ncbi:MAG: hypothetical protein H0X30_38045, partial [Anaerolineae bacterium]|nr:hypothetical protein [Anaerolineae bacterium]
ATTGDPLLLIKDVYDADPFFSCFTRLDAWVIANQSKQIILYLGGLLISAAYLVATILVKPYFFKQQMVTAEMPVS